MREGDSLVEEGAAPEHFAACARGLSRALRRALVLLDDCGLLAFLERALASGSPRRARDAAVEALAERLDRPDKYWKFNPNDIDERGFWPAYQEAYQAVLEKTSTEYAPWYVIPCDRKWYSRLAVTALLDEKLAGLSLQWPPADFDIEEQKRRLTQA